MLYIKLLCMYLCITCHVGFVKVAAVVGRADLLSALCFMSAFITYVCAVHSG